MGKTTYGFDAIGARVGLDLEENGVGDCGSHGSCGFACEMFGGEMNRVEISLEYKTTETFGIGCRWIPKIRWEGRRDCVRVDGVWDGNQAETFCFK